jgi:hypothetical protein
MLDVGSAKGGQVLARLRRVQRSIVFKSRLQRDSLFQQLKFHKRVQRLQPVDTVENINQDPEYPKYPFG